MTPYYERGGIQIFLGDCRERLGTLPDASVDAVVTDPPYELGFMGKGWDRSGVAFDPWTWFMVMRVLKPGGHLLAFGGSRTYHRMACAIEDAGFEIRDQIMWIYGSGFPKSLDISKGIDKAAGAVRERVGTQTGRGAMPRGDFRGGRLIGSDKAPIDTSAITAPATPNATQWSGWGSALKPAHEPIVLARKPLSEPTIAANVLAHGVGGINVDGCRIPGAPESTRFDPSKHAHQGWRMDATGAECAERASPAGRWPANVCLDPEAAAMLDAQSGDLTSGANPTRRNSAVFKNCYGTFVGQEECTPIRGADSGGASRFFYQAKASQDERNKGLPSGMINDHPCVKPLQLLDWLIRLVTPPGGTILDPFAGSGSVACSAARQGFSSISIEKDPHYVEIARHRIAYWASRPQQAEMFA